MRNPKDVGIMCFLRWVDDEAAKKGVNVIKKLCKRVGTASSAECRGAARVVAAYRASGHDVLQAEDVKWSCQSTHAVARPIDSQSVPSLRDSAAHQSRG
jgi:hypothetical protein